jgi:uncharacterized Zn finger protein (UPF0148 family)
MPNCPKCGTSLTRVSGTGTYYCNNAGCSEYNRKRYVPVELRQDTGVGRSTKPSGKMSALQSSASSVRDAR